jgi:protein-S-isoprenylcysteine O-methyltransferase Ste14
MGESLSDSIGPLDHRAAGAHHFRRLLSAACISASGLCGLLVGWGDVRSYWRDVPRTIIGVCLAVAPMVIVTIARNSGHGKPEDQRDQRLRVLGMMSVSLPIWLGIVAGLDRHEYLLRPSLDWVRWSGLVLFLFGWGIKLWAIMRLGRHYSIYVTLQENHELIWTGPYAIIRHPIYLGFILWVIGFSLVFRSWGGMLFVGAATAGAIRKLRREEAFMLRQFPESYADYSRRTWRLIPFVY